MKDNVGILYDGSLRSRDVAFRLAGRLSLTSGHVIDVSRVRSSDLQTWGVVMLVSSHWSDMSLPCEWHRLFVEMGLGEFSGRTIVPVGTSTPLSVSTAPALRRLFMGICVRIISPVEVFFVPEGHFVEEEESRRVDEWLAVFGGREQMSE